MRLYRRGKSKTWTLSCNYKGKRYVVSTRLTNKTLALEWAHKFESNLRFGKYFPDEDNVTWGRLCDLIRRYYVVEGRRSKGNLEIVLSRLQKRFGGMRAHHITTEKIEDYKAERLRAGVAKSTLNADLSKLSVMFRLAVEQGLLGQRPRIKEFYIADNARQGFVSWGDYLAIREHLPACLADLTDFLWWTGLRISTGRQLEWRDVHGDRGVESEADRGVAPMGAKPAINACDAFPEERRSHVRANHVLSATNTGTIRIRSETTKTQQAHEIPVIGPTADIIARAQAYRTLKTPLVFHRNGLPFTLQWCERHWKVAAREVGLEHIIIHDLRRSMVRNMRMAGVSDATIMGMTGHRSRSVFLRYNIVNVDEKADALERVAEFLGGQSKESKVRKVKP